ncbi:MCE family protein [Streptomyces sp. NPDC046805]|uniref:MCE family protein n=1 Tax=Streptomyces sp. NPDC046805 TaxID=3155134 RepID=UPI00340C3972
MKLRLYGVVFLAVLGLLLALTVAVYRQAFTPAVRIRLQANSLGNQLEPPADVKMRGLIVGQVREVHADGGKATLDIALDPADVSRIPADVNARLLPKTLFGERYVDLVEPKNPSARHIRAGDVIGQDRTKAGIELQQVMNDLLPLLRTVRPGELGATLSALADALEGRGDRIGDNLVRLDTYLQRLNPHMPALKSDIARLADVAQVYGDAAPDLLRTLRNTVTVSRTLVEKKAQFAALLTGTTTMSGTAREVLEENGRHLITLDRVSRPTLALLARYSPEYPCLLKGLVDEERRTEPAFQGGRFHITLEAVLPRPGYRPGEEPRYAEHRGPGCYGLPHPPVPAPGMKFDDGTKGSGAGVAVDGPRVSSTSAEQKVVGALAAPVMGVSADEVPPVTTLLLGPMIRGLAVSQA